MVKVKSSGQSHFTSFIHFLFSEKIGVPTMMHDSGSMAATPFVTASSESLSVMVLNGVQAENNNDGFASMASLKDDPPCIVGMGTSPHVP